MGDTTLVNLATVGSDELQAMPVGVFTSGLESMSADAIARFRRMRKLSATHRQALEKFLVEHPKSGLVSQLRPNPRKTARPAVRLRDRKSRASSWSSCFG